jgi:hypothetical protein
MVVEWYWLKSFKGWLHGDIGYDHLKDGCRVIFVMILKRWLQGDIGYDH